MRKHRLDGQYRTFLTSIQQQVSNRYGRLSLMKRNERRLTHSFSFIDSIQVSIHRVSVCACDSVCMPLWTRRRKIIDPLFRLDNHSMASTPPYPVLPSSSSSSSSPVMMRSTDSLRHQPAPPAMNRVQVLHAYDAEHDDELSIRPGEIITLLERRSDQWCKGSLRGNIGLFPGNFVQDI